VTGRRQRRRHADDTAVLDQLKWQAQNHDPDRILSDEYRDLGSLAYWGGLSRRRATAAVSRLLEAGGIEARLSRRYGCHFYRIAQGDHR
jgi:hypothetical protein